MTKQIAELKSRIAEIENEKRSAARFDEDALLRMMESEES
jgi:primosomal protein N''